MLDYVLLNITALAWPSIWNLYSCKIGLKSEYIWTRLSWMEMICKIIGTVSAIIFVMEKKCLSLALCVNGTWWNWDTFKAPQADKAKISLFPCMFSHLADKVRKRLAFTYWWQFFLPTQKSFLQWPFWSEKITVRVAASQLLFWRVSEFHPQPKVIMNTTKLYKSSWSTQNSVPIIPIIIHIKLSGKVGEFVVQHMNGRFWWLCNFYQIQFYFTDESPKIELKIKKRLTDIWRWR